MRCIYCGSNYNKVLNSRDTKKETQIWRRRKCITCKEVFTTYELVDMSHLHVQKKNGSVERFVPVKIFAGIFQASLYAKGADKGEQSVRAKELSDDVMLEIAKLNEKVISTFELKGVILKLLYKRAPDIFLRYLAYVDSPKTPSILRKQLEGLQD